MFADMVGYSRRMEQDEERNSTYVTRSVALFRQVIGDYGGTIANVAGDGILALFDNPGDALNFARRIQSELRDQAVWADGEPILFRIGLHHGEVLEQDGNFQGHCVNVAARLQELAEPGSIAVTALVRDIVGGLSGLSLHPMGRPQLKNIAEPVEVFLVGEAKTNGIWRADRMEPRQIPDAARSPSLAVLALANLSGDPTNEHVCEGIVEDIIANLSRFRSLMVIARHSAFQFDLKSKSAREIGRHLGARYLLNGSLRRAGRRLRIVVELIDTEVEKVHWSDRFEIAIKDLHEVQDEITSIMASRLAVQIDLVHGQQEAHYSRDMQAFDLVLRGRHLIRLYTREANAHAKRLFEEAIEIAPDYARAYSAMSRAHNLEWRYSWVEDPDRSLDHAVAFALSAIRRDQLDASAFAELGFAHLYKKMHKEALADYARALALNPNDADIVAEYADALVYCGQPEQALEALGKAMRLNPYYPDWYLWNLADAYSALGRFEDVIATVQRMQNPDEGRRLLAASYAHLGRLNEAREQAREILRLYPNFTISHWRLRPPHSDNAILERLVDGLRKAGLPKSADSGRRAQGRPNRRERVRRAAGGSARIFSQGLPALPARPQT